MVFIFNVRKISSFLAFYFLLGVGWGGGIVIISYSVYWCQCTHHACMRISVIYQNMDLFDCVWQKFYSNKITEKPDRRSVFVFIIFYIFLCLKNFSVYTEREREGGEIFLDYVNIRREIHNVHNFYMLKLSSCSFLSIIGRVESH